MTKLHFARWFSVIGFLSVASAGLTGCGVNPTAASATGHDLKMAALSDMSPDVRSAPVVVQQAYQFAVANPDLMKQIPCYCGCGAVGHTSNYDCYVSGREVGGAVHFDTHALGCSLCVDITQDTMRLLREGKSSREIRAYVDNTYAKYGSSNIP